MNLYQGISASSGIGIGNAYFLENTQSFPIPQLLIKDNEKEKSWKRFLNSLENIKKELEQSSDASNKDQSMISETYLMMLNDTIFLSEIKSAFYSSSFNIEYIVNKVVLEYAEKLRSLEDQYLMERAFDITDIFTRVIYNMLGYKIRKVTSIPEHSIIIAHAIQPSEAIEILKQNISGIVLNEGGVNSHLAILARSYGIPAIFGIDTFKIFNLKSFNTATQVIVDSNSGKVIIYPDEMTCKLYTEKKQIEQKAVERMNAYVGKPALTKDNVQFSMFANIGSVEEADNAIKNGADGIGLLRTEFLFMQAQDRNEILTEQTQFEFYKQILQKMGDKPVTMRTLDAGGDKVIHGMDDTYQEKNPLLGNRAIRFCLSRPDIFKTQLRALFRASVYGNLRILFPLISTVDQYLQIQKIVHEVKISLKTDEIEFKEDIPLGIMIETPSAAVCADLFAPLCDFFSIGTNDLTQYTLAVDRENLSVASLFDELCPCVIRLIKHTLESANKFKIPVTVCGEFASRKEGIKILAGLGIRNLSMTPTKINEAKEFLSLLTIPDMEKQIQDLL